MYIINTSLKYCSLYKKNIVSFLFIYTGDNKFKFCIMNSLYSSQNKNKNCHKVTKF